MIGLETACFALSAAARANNDLTLAASTAPSPLPFPSLRSDFAIGDRIVLSGLKSGTYNGSMGFIISLAGERCGILLDDVPNSISIHRSNITVFSSTANRSAGRASGSCPGPSSETSGISVRPTGCSSCPVVEDAVGTVHVDWSSTNPSVFSGVASPRCGSPRAPREVDSPGCVIGFEDVFVSGVLSLEPLGSDLLAPDVVEDAVPFDLVEVADGAVPADVAGFALGASGDEIVVLARVVAAPAAAVGLAAGAAGDEDVEVAVLAEGAAFALADDHTVAAVHAEVTAVGADAEGVVGEEALPFVAVRLALAVARAVVDAPAIDPFDAVLGEVLAVVGAARAEGLFGEALDAAIDAALSEGVEVPEIIALAEAAALAPVAFRAKVAARAEVALLAPAAALAAPAPEAARADVDALAPDAVRAEDAVRADGAAVGDDGGGYAGEDALPPEAGPVAVKATPPVAHSFCVLSAHALPDSAS